MKASVSGGCSCGVIRYFSLELSEQVTVCHCKACQAAGGSAFGIRVALYQRDLEVRGAEALVRYVRPGASGRSSARSFCSRCGSQLFITYEGIPSLVFIQAGTLDDSTWIHPTTHIWCGEKQPWLTIPADALAS